MRHAARAGRRVLEREPARAGPRRGRRGRQRVEEEVSRKFPELKYARVDSDSMRGSRDGSLPEFYRYMIDAASMDFGAVTDHSAGGDVEGAVRALDTAVHEYVHLILAEHGYVRRFGRPHVFRICCFS